MLDTGTGKPVGKPLELGAGNSARPMISSLAFSADSKRIVAGTDSNTDEPFAQIWDVETCQQVGPLLRHPGSGFNQIAFCADGKKILAYTRTQGEPCGFWWWDVETGQRLPGLATHKFDERYPLRLSPDRRSLLTKTGDNTARLWDVETGRPRGRNLPALARIVDMAFSQDSQVVVTTSEVLRFWDVATGQPIGKPRRIGLGVARHPVFSSDSRTLLAVFEIGGARLFNVPQPVEGDPARLRHWVQVITGQELDAGGAITDLDAATWQDRYDRLQKLGGPPVW